MVVLAGFGPPLPGLSGSTGTGGAPAEVGVVVSAALLAGAGILIALLGVREFRRAQTTVDPRYPERSSQLVSSGIYRRTRNPMYLGMLLCLVAVAVYLQHLLPWFVLPAFVVYMGRYQIRPEERAMLNAFGADYEAYCNRVRRWL
jgi:protein-S-isoprenylcysteine O-methyltransferase Ste14